MVASVRERLTTLGWHRKQIVFERSIEESLRPRIDLAGVHLKNYFR